MRRQKIPKICFCLRTRFRPVVEYRVGGKNAIYNLFNKPYILVKLSNKKIYLVKEFLKLTNFQFSNGDAFTKINTQFRTSTQLLQLKEHFLSQPKKVNSTSTCESMLTSSTLLRYSIYPLNTQKILQFNQLFYYLKRVIRRNRV